MEVSFSEKINIPDNYTYFDNNVINITVIPGSESDITKLAFNWTLKEFY